VGAIISTLLVLLLLKTNKAHNSMLRMPLMGMAITLLFSSLTQALLTFDESSLATALFWLAGSVSERELGLLWQVLPILGLGLLLSAGLVFNLDLFLLDEKLASNLSPALAKVKLIAFIAICLLTAGCVTLAGPISFIGLIVPHMVKACGLNKHQWMLPGCFFVGAILLTLADILSRYIIFPHQAPVGAVTALIGAPIFIYFVVNKNQQVHR